jgi:hypothetical protein
MCSFTSKLILLIFIFNIGFTEQGTENNFDKNTKFYCFAGLVFIQCSNSFDTENDTNICYYYTKKSFSWLDAYNQCLTQTIDGILMQIFSLEQFNSLKNANIDQTSLIWLGANNFASCK